MAKIVYVLGIIAAIWCVLDIIHKPWNILKKIVVAALVLIFSWIGFLAYYFLLRKIL